MALLRGYGWTPLLRRGLRPGEHAPGDGRDPGPLRRRDPRRPAGRPAPPATAARPRWPMIVLRTPEGLDRAGRGRRAQARRLLARAPGADGRRARTNPAHLALLETWMRSYRPEELFDADGTPGPRTCARCAPKGARRMGANPHANGGLLKKALRLPDFRDYAVEVEKPGAAPRRRTPARSAHFLRDVMRAEPAQLPRLRPGREHLEQARRHLRGDARSSGWRSTSPRTPTARELAADGRVIEMLSEHTLEGMLEGYLLTGRHGFFSTYEAFVHVIDSMFNQHAKWLRRSATSSPGGRRSPRSTC